MREGTFNPCKTLIWGGGGGGDFSLNLDIIFGWCMGDNYGHTYAGMVKSTLVKKNIINYKINFDILNFRKH